eukprot:gnl/TRDRNA2_/TRDRNA2_84544_c0_seq1.p1 gnl/TRDRNA2_/TRDRNA2_84544_c0~~gnl/TRDRNA2_/TRDRNA2_84544_c0_seq1.p1  ORF type:complete len:212 (-),score=5.95 gnl/TRDRNA2_/TRDRNA2_84544_c0_seq1:137-691(-)
MKKQLTRSHTQRLATDAEMKKKPYEVQRAQQAGGYLARQIGRAVPSNAALPLGLRSPRMPETLWSPRTPETRTPETPFRALWSPQTPSIGTSPPTSHEISRLSVEQGWTANRSGSSAAYASSPRDGSRDADDEDVNTMAVVAVEGLPHGRTRRDVTRESAVGLIGRCARDPSRVSEDSSDIASL